MGWVFGAISSGLVSVVLASLFQERLTKLLARVISRLRRPHKREIAGQWFAYWSLIPEQTSSATARLPSSVINVFVVSRWGSRVTGKDPIRKGSTIAGTLVDNTILTGTWRDTSGDRYQWGSFQMCWSSGGSGMVGKFVGKDSRNHINHGIWIWARRAEDLKDLAESAVSQMGYELNLDVTRESIDSALEQQHLIRRISSSQ